MTLETMIGAATAVAILLYLLYTLLRPEKF